MQITVSGQFVKISESIKAKNTGDKAVDRLTLCHAKQDSGLVAYQKVVQQHRLL